MGRKRTPAEQLTRLEREAEIEEKRLAIEQMKLDRLVAQERRKHIKSLSTYEAAKKDRTTQDWRAPTKTADQAILPDAGTLNARGRQIIRDTGIGQSIKNGMRRGVVGIGVTPRSAARNPLTGEPLKEFNDRVDLWWEPWATTPEFCDVEGRRTWVEHEGLVICEFTAVGESFTVLSYEPRADMVGLCLQAFEPEQLDDRKLRNEETGNQIKAGVEVNKFGRAVGYWLHTGSHPWEKFSREPTFIPAERVRHFFRPERVRQARGVTLMCAVLHTIRHLGMYDHYQIIAARYQSCIGGHIETGNLEEATATMGLPLEEGETGKDSRYADEIAMEPGMMPRLRPGEKIVYNTPTAPGSQYDPFMKAQIARIAAGVGLDYATVARDYSQGSYTSQRQGRLEKDQELDPIQLLLIDTVGRPVRKSFKTWLILEGKVEAPGFFSDPLWQWAYLKDEWQGPPKYWIDPVKQAAAAKILLDYKLTSRKSWLNQFGASVGDLFAQLEEELRDAAEKGISLPDAQAKGEPGRPVGTPKENLAALLGGSEEIVEDLVLDVFGPQLGAYILKQAREEASVQ